MEKNPKYNTFKLPDGYRDLGWQLHPGNSPEVKNCCDLRHNNQHWREFDNSLYIHRCTNVITICDACKIVWHTDMSD